MSGSAFLIERTPATTLTFCSMSFFTSCDPIFCIGKLPRVRRGKKTKKTKKKKKPTRTELTPVAPDTKIVVSVLKALIFWVT
jgi:hypothetical protein